MKKVEQINKAGNIVIDYDQTLSVGQITSLMRSLFDPVLKLDEKQYVLYDKLGLLVCNVTYLGHPHPTYKKRIQLKTYYLDYLIKNTKNGIKTLYVGIYTYNSTRLFVVFEPSTYAHKKSHNSSAHVFSINLQYAQKVGTFSKIDAFGNKVRVFNTYEFIRYIKTLAGDELADPFGENIMALITKRFGDFKGTIPLVWKGVDCYKQLIASNDHNARQGEWQGWYFEYLFKKYLSENRINDISWHADRTDGGVDLDIKFACGDWVYGDLKADQINSGILGNSLDTLDVVLRNHNGSVYYVCCLYKSEKDSDHNYVVTSFWNSLRDNPYTSETDLRQRYGKRMKYSVTPVKLCVLKIDAIIYEILRKTPFAQGVNSDGNERKPKLKVNKDMISALSVFVQDF